MRGGGGEIGAIFYIFGCLEVFGSWLGPGSCYFGGWKGWKLENGGLEGGQCGAKIKEQGGLVVAMAVFGPWVEDIQEGGKQETDISQPVAPLQGGGWRI